MFFDPFYLFLVILPSLVLGIGAQIMVKSAYARAGRIPARSGLTGAQAAARILEMNGLDQVGIEPVRSFLGDHYDPRHKVLRLSPEVYNGRSLAALGVAAHEAGHALQDRVGYAPLALRNGIVPLANFGSNTAFIILIIGAVLHSMGWMLVGIALFSMVVLFQLINLPVEFNASRRAREVLLSSGIIMPAEEPIVQRVLNAAALTYVAATITAILTLLYWLMRSGLLGGRRD